MANIEKFRQFGISEGILKVIAELGFSEPSEIQQKAMPLVIAGKDVIGKSATGSGKTLAFSVGMIDKIKKGTGVSALILTPTRELAEQVSMNVERFSKNHKLNVVKIYGGVSMEPQIRQLRHADIVVGTPGRILDHLKRRILSLSKVKFLVLDEADRMLDMGFIKSVESIIKMCPKERQTLLFSATMPDEVNRIANQYMINPVSVSAKDQIDPSQLCQKYYDVPANEKFSLLLHLLKLEKNGVVMVFCNTRRNVDKLANNLNRQGVYCMAIHGGLSQNKRSDTLEAFHKRDTLILICTDVAARGLDIKDVSHIYNFDIPSTPDEYIHRVGRTARAGKNGIAISFVSSGDYAEFRKICNEKSINIERESMPEIEIIPIAFNSNADRKMARRNPGGYGRGFGRRQGRGLRDRRQGREGRMDNRGRDDRRRNRGGRDSGRSWGRR